MLDRCRRYRTAIWSSLDQTVQTYKSMHESRMHLLYPIIMNFISLWNIHYIGSPIIVTNKRSGISSKNILYWVSWCLLLSVVQLQSKSFLQSTNIHRLVQPRTAFLTNPHLSIHPHIPPPYPYRTVPAAHTLNKHIWFCKVEKVQKRKNKRSREHMNSTN